MPDPNSSFVRSANHGMAAYSLAVNSGLLPVAIATDWPTIVFRWKMHHELILIPTSSKRGMISIEEYNNQNVSSSWNWVDGMWIEAWAYALFSMHNALNIFTNAWTSLQENKPKILELKMAYDTAVVNPGQQITILTVFLMSEACKSNKNLAAASHAGLRRAQLELKEST